MHWCVTTADLSTDACPCALTKFLVSHQRAERVEEMPANATLLVEELATKFQLFLAPALRVVVEVVQDLLARRSMAAGISNCVLLPLEAAKQHLQLRRHHIPSPVDLEVVQLPHLARRQSPTRRALHHEAQRLRERCVKPQALRPSQDERFNAGEEDALQERDRAQSRERQGILLPHTPLNAIQAELSACTCRCSSAAPPPALVDVVPDRRLVCPRQGAVGDEQLERLPQLVVGVPLLELLAHAVREKPRSAGRPHERARPRTHSDRLLADHDRERRFFMILCCRKVAPSSSMMLDAPIARILLVRRAESVRGVEEHAFVDTLLPVEPRHRNLHDVDAANPVM